MIIRWRAAWVRLCGDWLLWTRVALSAARILLDPARMREYPALVDGHPVVGIR